MANDEHLRIIGLGVNSWNEWRNENLGITPDLSGADLSLAYLSSANLYGANLIDAKISYANLARADLRYANLQGAKLKSADLTYADLGGAWINKSNLRNATLLGASLKASLMNSADLSQADLRYTDLIAANLSDASLRDSTLTSALLSKAILIGASLVGSDLVSVDLRDSDLTRADLTGADLTAASLIGANLSNATLKAAVLAKANLFNAKLDQADLGSAVIGWTIFGNNNLELAKGLDSVQHNGPSTIGIDTIFRSNGRIPNTFLRGAGVSDSFVTFMASLTEQAIEYYSCFLSHAEADGDFADRLRNDLLSNNVSCWHYRYDMRGGQFWRVQINAAIKVHEKLILVCSERSLQKRNVVDEIITAMEQERELHSQKLFPLRLDDFISSDNMLQIADEKMMNGEWREDWVRYIRAYHIPDFSNWKNHDAYNVEFLSLLDALKTPAKR